MLNTIEIMLIIKIKKMTIGTATNHNTDFSNILGERSNATHYYTTQQIIDEDQLIYKLVMRY